ncbi:hypothetical protein MA6G0125S_5044 [Mycobacteroides abscessus 6G-0125-S]|nr:hypothetical protein MA6G0125S_5044 [Mycobacteroides abscessus 6G-0125-S]
MTSSMRCFATFSVWSFEICLTGGVDGDSDVIRPACHVDVTVHPDTASIIDINGITAADV